jgi:hypothetical protein
VGTMSSSCSHGGVQDRVEAVVLLASAQRAIKPVVCSEFADRDRLVRKPSALANA